MSLDWYFRSGSHGMIRVGVVLLSVALFATLVLTHAVSCIAAAENTNHAPNVPMYHSSVSEVRVTFFATDENNHSRATLAQSDFAVVDSDSVVRNFRSFTRSDETALDVVVLADVSESVAPRLPVAISDVLQLVAREQSIPHDSFSVLLFGGTTGGTVPAILCSSNCDASETESRLEAVKSGGATPLFDALIWGADFISHHRRAGARSVVILFSDGNDTISLHSAREALKAVLAEGALIYSVDIGTPGKSSAGSVFLRQVSDATGGRYFSARFSSHEGAATLLNAVMEDLRASYVVTYDPPSHQAGFHSFRLLPTHNLNLTFHSRNGYYREPGVR